MKKRITEAQIKLAINRILEIKEGGPGSGKKLYHKGKISKSSSPEEINVDLHDAGVDPKRWTKARQSMLKYGYYPDDIDQLMILRKIKNEVEIKEGGPGSGQKGHKTSHPKDPGVHAEKLLATGYNEDDVIEQLRTKYGLSKSEADDEIQNAKEMSIDKDEDEPEPTNSTPSKEVSPEEKRRNQDAERLLNSRQPWEDNYRIYKTLDNMAQDIQDEKEMSDKLEKEWKLDSHIAKKLARKSVRAQQGGRW